MNWSIYIRLLFTPILEGVGALVGLIRVGRVIAVYLDPNTEKELTEAVNKYEKK